MAGLVASSFFMVCVCLLGGYEVLGSSIYGPKIDDVFQTVLELNQTHTVFCKGHKPLMWSVPKVADSKKSWTQFITHAEQPTDPDFEYGSRLQILNMSYPFVGYYYCHYADADKDNDEESDSVYLYVNDPVHLTTLEGDEADITEVVVTQYSDALIPCRPTSPEVRVTLSTDDGKEIEDANYDPKTGFSFFVSDLSQQQLYTCVAILNSNYSSISNVLIYLSIRSKLPTSHLAKPSLEDLSEEHTVVGDPLILKCLVKSKNLVDFHWTTPHGPAQGSRMELGNQKREGYDKYVQTLTVYNTTEADRGTYFCNVTDKQDHKNFAALDVKIFQTNEYFLYMRETNDVFSIIASAGDPSVQWSVEVKGHPQPTVSWLDNKNHTIQMGNGSKYETSYNRHTDTVLLKIRTISITDFGNYTLLVSNNKTEKLLTFFLNVTDKPTVQIESNLFYVVNTSVSIKCYAYAYPEPEFQWEHKACPSQQCPFQQIEGTVLSSEGFEFISEITINATESGYVKCKASNYKGVDQEVKGYIVTDIEDGFAIFDLDNSVEVNAERTNAVIAMGETIKVTCGASKYNYSMITWMFNDDVLINDDRRSMINTQTNYSNKLQLEIPEARSSDTGLYSCRVVKDGEYLYKNISFTVTTPQEPSVTYTTMDDDLEMTLPNPLKIFCQVYGIPKPSVTWYKNQIVFKPSDRKRIKVGDDNQYLIFSQTNVDDEGTYKCVARNKMGEVMRQQMVKFSNKPGSQTWLLVLVVVLSIACVGALALIAFKIRKEKKLQRELGRLGLSNFEKGAVENINPELGIDDQAELLPYDRKWEFPIENLKLGKQLGSGAFGVVMKGEAKNILEGEPVSTVAVKMVKKNAEHTYIRALASELKIMVHLGKHLNVVNLLGACTKNVAKKELLVIVEYCRFGNLQNYLLRHRDNYIDQVDQKSGKIDHYIGQEYLDRTYSVSSDRSNTQSPSLKYAALTFSNSSNQPILPPSNSMGDYRANANTANTEMTTVTQGEDGVILSNNSVQPEWRSNYRGDYKGNVKPICTSDLLAWAFQVARGMEYLATRKVLHGDLAARNILLGDNNVVKICDFGLAKSMYKNDNYKKRGDGPLPVKWMAIESIRDRIFSTQSDVWSFGIVLWEFFSLAKTPYPGMEADERLYQKLVEGYRMESPQYAPKEVYKMMSDCWAPKPLARPSFTNLAETIGSLLEDSLRKHYIDLNDPYLVMNTQRLEEGESDYLAMLSPPTFEALSSPHYVNENVGQESLEDSGYLSMKPSTIFSPRVEDGQIFDFSVSNRKHLDSEEGHSPELLPMLHRSDSEMSAQSPTSPNSFSNPSYHIPPKIVEESCNNNTDIVKSADNYVNMPQNKSSINDKSKAGNNPFVNMEDKKGEVHYVNGNSRDWESIQV